MATKKKYYRHSVYCTAEDDKFIKKFYLSPSKIYQEALMALRHSVCETPGKQTVYLSKSTNAPKRETIVDQPASAQTAPPATAATVHPAAPTKETKEEPARPFVSLADLADLVDRADHVAVADHAVIRPDPVPAPTVLIVRKRPPGPAPIIPTIMKRTLCTDFMQLPDRG